MFERPSGGNAAVRVGLDFGAEGHADRLGELTLLAASAGMAPRALVQGRRARPDPSLFAGAGKVEEIRQRLREHGAQIAVFNHDLSPAQERNLEKALEARVMDRTSLILNIF